MHCHILRKIVFDGCLHSHGACFLWHDACCGWHKSVLVPAGAGKPFSKPVLAKTSVQTPVTDLVASANHRLENENRSVQCEHGPCQPNMARVSDNCLSIQFRPESPWSNFPWQDSARSLPPIQFIIQFPNAENPKSRAGELLGKRQLDPSLEIPLSKTFVGDLCRRPLSGCAITRIGPRGAVRVLRFVRFRQHGQLDKVTDKDRRQRKREGTPSTIH